MAFVGVLTSISLLLAEDRLFDVTHNSRLLVLENKWCPPSSSDSCKAYLLPTRFCILWINGQLPLKLAKELQPSSWTTKKLLLKGLARWPSVQTRLSWRATGCLRLYCDVVSELHNQQTTIRPLYKQLNDTASKEVPIITGVSQGSHLALYCFYFLFFLWMIYRTNDRQSVEKLQVTKPIGPSCSISHKISKSDSSGGEPVICAAVAVSL